MSPSHPTEPDRFILVGLRGAGKTACGRMLSELAGCGFVDIDDVVAKMAGKEISAIFSEKGEQAFRAMESEAMKGIASRTVPEVIATGGGAVLSRSNRALLSRLGLVAYLRVPAETLVRRLETDSKTKRPALTPYPLAREMEELFREREPLYLEVAHLVVEADGPIDQLAVYLHTLWKTLKSLYQADDPAGERSST